MARTPNRVSDAEFVRTVASLHQHGQEVAQEALAHGMRPDWWAGIALVMCDNPDAAPRLYFEPDAIPAVRVEVDREGVRIRRRRTGPAPSGAPA